MPMPWLVAGALSLTACGTTVPPSGLAGPGTAAVPGALDDGLGGPPPAAEPGKGGLPGASGSGTAATGGRPTTSLGSGSPPVTSGQAPAGAPAVRAPGRAGSPARDRRPVKVGIVYTNNDGAASAGVDNGNTFTPRRVYEGIVAAYNARGGLGGRKAETTYVELQSSSTSLSADLQAACTTFTQDAEVDVVLSTIGLHSEQFASCLARAGIPQIAGDYALGDDEALRRTPTLIAPATLTTDERVEVLLEQMVAVKRLTRDSRIGIVVEGCPFNTRTYDRTLAPTAQRLGLSLVSRADGRCFEGIGDLSGITTDMQAAVLRFQQDRVDRVLFVSGSVEGNFLLFFATAAESQGYRPGYALTSAAVPAVQEANTPPAQLAGAAGVGWLPSIDTAEAPAQLPAGRQCLADVKAGSGAVPTSPADRFYAYSVCTAAALYDTALRATSGASDQAAVTAALDRTGTSFAAPVVHGERTDFRGGRRTGPAQGRVFAWGSCACFSYVGTPFQLDRSETS